MERCMALPAASLLQRVLAGDVESSTCALCLCDDSLLPSALPLTLESGQTITVEELAKESQLTEILTDLRPKNICTFCVNQMKNFYVFRKKCLETKLYLKTFINTLDNDTAVASDQFMELYPKDALDSIENVMLHIKSDLKTLKSDFCKSIHQLPSCKVKQKYLPKYLCDFCKCPFSNKHYLRTHISSKHSTSLNSPESESCIKKRPNQKLRKIKKIAQVQCVGNVISKPVQNMPDPLAIQEIDNQKINEMFIYNHNANRDVVCKDCHGHFPNRLALSIHKCQRDMSNVTLEVLKGPDNEIKDNNVEDTSDDDEAVESDASNISVGAPKAWKIKRIDSVLGVRKSQIIKPTNLSEAIDSSLHATGSQIIKETKLIGATVPYPTKRFLKKINSSVEEKYQDIIKSDLSLMETDPSLKATKARIIKEIKKEVNSNLYPDDKKHKCKICAIELKSHQSLLFHHLREHEIMKDTYHCKLCNRGFKTETALKVHYFNLHGKEKEYDIPIIFSCKICSKCFHTHNELIHHKFRSHKIEVVKEPRDRELGGLKQKPRRFPCAKCEKLLTSNKKRMQHESTHPPGTRFLCQGCNKTFTTREERSECLKTHDKRKECPVCGRTFRNLPVHIRTHSKVKTKPVPNIESPKSYKCDVCGSIENSISDLETHVERHEKQEECPVCSEMVPASRMRSHLDDHQKILRPIMQCPDCTFSTVFVGNYERHLIDMHHKGKHLKCEVCGEKFCAKETLATHQIVHDEFSLPCTKCEKKFRSIRGHQLHMMKHIGLLKFPCQVCGKRFVRAGDRNEHQAKVHGNPDLKCPVCFEFFLSSRALTRHRREKHKEARRRGAKAIRGLEEKNVFVIYKKPAIKIEAQGTVS